MRHGRAKAARKTLQYFNRAVGLKAPYSILLDATLVVALFQQKILPFKERVDRVLQTTGADGPNKYCISKGAVDELKTIYKSLSTKKHSKALSFEQALEFIQNECIILNKETTTDADDDDDGSKVTTSVQEDLLHHVQHDEKPYIVATQDERLLDKLRSMGTVPIVRLANNSVLILENPSKQSQAQFKGIEKKKWRHGLHESEQELVNLVRKQKREASKQNVHDVSPAPRHQRKSSKAKGPNPLSCKRKQGSDGKQSGKESSSKKRRLRAKKIKSSEAA